MSNMGVLENDSLRVSVSAQRNTWELLDRQAQVTWGSPSGEPWVSCRRDVSGHEPLLLSRVVPHGDGLQCYLADSSCQEAPFTLILRLAADALQVYLLPTQAESLPEVVLFMRGIESTPAEQGDALIPIRMGLLVPAAGEQPFDREWGTYDYEGLHMAMAGMLKCGAALLATWHDPYLRLRLARHVGAEGPFLRMGFRLAGSACSLQLQCLGKSDLSTMARAYRERAQGLGYRVPWQVKLAERPQAARLFGACNVKLWHALARRIDKDLQEQSVEVRWTFDEVAQVAEHLKRDLEIEDVLFHLGGWTRYGYDCRHPDIMPANPECGGNAGLADCARRVQACGYLFCLHDNYQDMYRDAPSWDEAYLQRDADGQPHVGGVWLGGQAYYTCAHEALRLAQRPQNLPAVREAFHPDVYFIDTTYAVGAQECFDPRHPLTKSDDIHWKQVLSDYARDLFGLFGSECGREWAVPHADFFEGLASVAGRYYHSLDPNELNARVVPFFDMVFGDCIVIHGKYGYRPEEMAEQVIHHVAIGRTLYYHSLGEHLYWQETDATAEWPESKDRRDAALFTRAHNGWAEGLCLWDRFIKNTQEALGPLNRLTSQTYIEAYEFLDRARLIRRTTFANGIQAIVNGSADDYLVGSKRWGDVLLPPYGFLVEADTWVAFHALSWNGHAYRAPVLFTLQSQDDQALDVAQSVRVYHGFGEADLAWRGRMLEVRREAMV